SAPCTYTRSLHDALPILAHGATADVVAGGEGAAEDFIHPVHHRFLAAEVHLELQGAEAHLSDALVARLQEKADVGVAETIAALRSEEHTSELQSRENLVC